MTHKEQHFDCIVIGVGGMGSAACYELAKRGKRVLGLERFDIPHSRGSSHGITRIIRLAYYEHPDYVTLLRRAYQLWAQLERQTGARLLHKIGSVDIGLPDSWVFKGSLQSVQAHDIDHQVLTAAEINRRFPGYQLPHGLMALYQKDGGFLLPERCTIAYVNLAIAAGATIHARETVLDWQPRGDGVQVRSDRATYTADALVISAGAWNRRLLPLLQSVAVPERQVLAWLQPQRPELFAPERFPVFNMEVEEGRWYGFPIFGVPGFKFGKYRHRREEGEPEAFDWEPNQEDERLLRTLADRYFPQGSGPTMGLKTCMFTNSPDGHFIIDLHPTFPQVSFAAGFSGHGYKFASVVGEIMADLATERRSRHAIDLFRLQRLSAA